jgi:hypothetical protein
LANDVEGGETADQFTAGENKRDIIILQWVFNIAGDLVVHGKVKEAHARNQKNVIRGHSQRMSGQMMDFQTPPPPLSGIVRISDTPPISPDIRHASKKLTQPCICQG